MPWKSMVASIGVGLVNNALSQNNSKEQRDWQEQMWNKQNAYNHPAAQSDRLRSAGLNPYLMTGAEPAGSVGSSPPAQTIPFENPLAYAKTFAEIDNLAAHTNNLDADTQNLYKAIAIQDQQLQRGIISLEEYRFNVKKYFEAYEEANPYTIQKDNTEADTKKKVADASLASEQAKKAESDRLFTEALTATENALREPRIASERAKTAALSAQAQESLAKASKTLLEGKTVELQNERDALRNSAIEFYGFDPTTMPNELAATLMNNFAAVVEHNYSDSVAKDAMDKAHDLLKTYRNKSIWTPTTDSFGWNSGFKLGDFEIKYGTNSTTSR